MRTLFITTLAAILLISTATIGNAQSAHRPKKQGFTDINLGIGLLNTYLKDQNAPSTGLPLSASIDYRLQRNFSLGAFAGFSSSQGAQHILNSETAIDWQNRTTVAGLRFAAHSNQLGNWEFYGGSTAGLHMSHFKIMNQQEKRRVQEQGYKEYNTRFYMTGFLGARFQLNKKLRLFSEIGMGDSLLKLGASVRL